ncbi:hypothetical protein COLO4_38083 [Corchorus olitorius]|uniref:Uncharacterized protein n=1 Tax=Corchorus olitorius TaxID=93759 RepID=A0A1R3FX55_9ROSI|nr:hypothetical protein COLO4_38083 [Corchorus olitorius]
MDQRIWPSETVACAAANKALTNLPLFSFSPIHLLHFSGIRHFFVSI